MALERLGVEAGAEGRVQVERTLSLFQIQELEQKIDHQRKRNDGDTAKNAERRSWKSPTPIQIFVLAKFADGEFGDFEKRSQTVWLTNLRRHH